MLTAPLEISTEDRPDPELLGKAVRKALDGASETGRSRHGRAARAGVLRTLSLPASDNLGELASMVHLQIGKDLPFRKDDAVIDFRVVRRRRLRRHPIEGASLISSRRCRSWKCSWRSHNWRSSIHKGVASAAGVKLTGLGCSYANARCVQACGIAQGREPVACFPPARRGDRRRDFGGFAGVQPRRDCVTG